jgi:hypothetical protein
MLRNSSHARDECVHPRAMCYRTPDDLPSTATSAIGPTRRSVAGVSLSRHLGPACILSILVGALLGLASCARGPEWAMRLPAPEADSSGLALLRNYPNANALILLDEGTMEIFGGDDLGFSEFKQHRIVKILTALGQRYANVVIPYSGESRIEGIKARTISASGQVTPLEEKNIFDVSLYPNFVFFSDQRAKLFTLPAVDDGSTVEYEYSVVVRNRTLWHSWGFQNESPTLLSRFTLIKPGEWDIHYRLYGLELEPTVTKAPSGFKSTHVWEARNISPIQAEFSMPPMREQAARLALAPLGFTTWGDVSLWYLGLARSRMKAGPALTTVSLQITQGAENDREKLRRIFEWVRDKVRYVAVEIGIGGYQPHPADEVYTNMYGDCKDMVTILCAMGSAVGLDVRQVLVSTWQNGKPDTSLPSPLQFNHVVTYCSTVGKDGVWMDATEKGCAFGQLPWYDQGLPVLVVGEKGEERLAVTPRAAPEENQEQVEWMVDLLPSGAASINGAMHLRGAVGAELREDLLSASAYERRLWLETFLAKRCAGALLDSFQITGVDPVREPLSILFTFRAPFFGTRSDSVMIIHPGMSSSTDLSDYFRSPARKHPIRLHFGVSSELDLTVNLPEGWEQHPIGSQDSVSSSFGLARWSWQTGRRRFTARSSVLLQGEDIPVEKYTLFQKFLDDIKERELRVVMFRKASPLPEDE